MTTSENKKTVTCESCSKEYNEKEGVRDDDNLFRCFACLPVENIEFSVECEQAREDVFIAGATLYNKVEKQYIGYPKYYRFNSMKDAEEFAQDASKVKTADVQDLNKIYIKGIECVGQESEDTPRQKIFVKGYWKDSGDKLEVGAIIGKYDESKDTDNVFFWFNDSSHIVADHGDFVLESYSLEDEVATESLIVAESKESFLLSVTNSKEYGDEIIEIPYGSNKSALVEIDKSVLFNTYNEEQMKFITLEDFAKWYYEDDKSVSFEYQINLGTRDEGEEFFRIPEISTMQQDDSEDGSIIWSVFIKLDGDTRSSVTFPKDLSRLKKMFDKLGIEFDKNLHTEDKISDYIEALSKDDKNPTKENFIDFINERTEWNICDRCNIVAHSNSLIWDSENWECINYVALCVPCDIKTIEENSNQMFTVIVIDSGIIDCAYTFEDGDEADRFAVKTGNEYFKEVDSTEPFLTFEEVEKHQYNNGKKIEIKLFGVDKHFPKQAN